MRHRAFGDAVADSEPIGSLLLADGKVRNIADQATDMLRGDVAIKGYDPVAYFTEGRPVLGKEEFAEDQTPFTKLNYKGGTMVILFSGRDITVEFNLSV